MARRSRGSNEGNKNIIKIGDLSSVETSTTVPEGRHIVTVDDAEVKESSSGNPYISFIFLPESGGKVFHNSSLQPQALFNLKSVLVSLGFPIPDKAFDLDITELIGLECEVEVTHEKYDGKVRPRITEFYPANGDDNEEEEGSAEDELNELDLADLKDVAKALGIKISRKATEDELKNQILEFSDEDIFDALDDLED